MENSVVHTGVCVLGSPLNVKFIYAESFSICSLAQKAELHLSFTQLPFNVNGSRRRRRNGRQEKKIPSEFVIMIDSCVQKAGNLFQNFHGCFFDLLLFCLIDLNNLHSFDIEFPLFLSMGS